MRRICICVDDFGLKPEVNEAVAALVDAGLVTATGALTQAPCWARGAREFLQPRRAGLDVGLHLNLTETFAPASGSARGAAAFALPLGRVIALSLLRLLPSGALHQTIRAQLDAFEEAWGAAPDFVDGHQHVHQLPQVREALLEELARRPGCSRVWLRSTRARGPAAFKPWVIETLGAHAFERQVLRRGHAMNQALLGVYGFDATAEGYRRRLEQWFERAQDGDLLMVHPAAKSHAAPSNGDPIAGARELEHAVLLAQGATLLASHGVQPVRLSLDSSILRRRTA